MDNQVFKFVLLNYKNETKGVYTYGKDSASENTYSISLFQDDTIENIKYKLCSVLDDTDINQYSFFYKTQDLWKDAKQIFLKLSNNKDIISAKEMEIFWINHEIPYESPEDIDYYTYEQFLELYQSKIQTSDSYLETKSLEFNLPSHKCIMNPLLNTKKYKFDSPIEYINANLLFEMGNIHENTIYGVHKNDFLQYIQGSTQSILSIYYPLHDKTSELSNKYVYYNSLIQKHYDFEKKYNTTQYSKLK